MFTLATLMSRKQNISHAFILKKSTTSILLFRINNNLTSRPEGVN